MTTCRRHHEYRGKAIGGFWYRYCERCEVVVSVTPLGRFRPRMVFLGVLP